MAVPRSDLTAAVGTALAAQHGYTLGFLAQLNFDSVVTDSSISWELEGAGVPASQFTTVVIECSINDGGDWTPVGISGDPIPVLENGKSYAGRELIIRQTFYFPLGEPPPRLKSLTVYIEWDSGASDLTVIEGPGGTAFKSPGQSGYDPETHGTYLGTVAEGGKVAVTPLGVLEFGPDVTVECDVSSGEWLTKSPLYPDAPDKTRIFADPDEPAATVELLRIVVPDPTADSNNHPLIGFDFAVSEGARAWYNGNDLFADFVLYFYNILQPVNFVVLSAIGVVQPNTPFDLAIVHELPGEEIHREGAISEVPVGSNQILFVNGTERARGAYKPYALATTQRLMLGRNAKTDERLQSGVQIGEVRCWSRALTGSEIIRRRSRRLTTAEKALDELKLLWEFDEGQGSVLNDASGHSRTGQINSTGNPWRTVRGLIGRTIRPNKIRPHRISPPISLDVEGQNVIRAATTPKGMDVVWNGNTYLGLGEFGNVDVVRDSPELESPGLRFTMSGVNAARVSLALQEEYIDRRCSLWLVWWETSTGTLQSNPLLIFRGRMDKMPIVVDETSATITIMAENEFANWERQTIRRWNDEDQQRLFPGDEGLGLLARTNNRTIYWPTVTRDLEPGA